MFDMILVSDLLKNSQQFWKFAAISGFEKPWKKLSRKTLSTSDGKETPKNGRVSPKQT